MKKVNWKELWKKCFGKEKDERSHAIAMLAIYGVFILMLVIMIRISPTEETEYPQSSPTPSPSPTTNAIPSPNSTPNENPDSSTQEFDINYSYIYTIEKDGKKEVFTGKKLDDKEIFTMINENESKNYAKLSDNYLIKENGEYHLTEAPSENLRYTDVETLLGLTDQASLTKNDQVYSYAIPVNEVIKTYYPEETVTVDNSITDTIVITTYQNIIKSIDVNLNQTQIALNPNKQTTLTIHMEFNNIGTTEDFNVTVSN